MWCPDCKKDVELSKGDPQVSRVRMDGTIVKAAIEIGDICGECGRQLRGIKMDVERDLKDVKALKMHLEHKWKVEPLKYERIMEPDDYGSAKIHYGLTCDCERMPMYEGTLLGSLKLLTSP